MRAPIDALKLGFRLRKHTIPHKAASRSHLQRSQKQACAYRFDCIKEVVKSQNLMQ
jgi:hypothetical protein